MAGGESGVVGKNTWIRKGQTLSDGSNLVNKLNGEANGHGGNINGHSEKTNGHSGSSNGYGKDENEGMKNKRRKGEAIINLGGMNQCSMKAGDRIVISELSYIRRSDQVSVMRLLEQTAKSDTVESSMLIFTYLDTPGGGGYGVPGTVDDRLDDEVYQRTILPPVRASGSLAAMRAAAFSN